MCYSKMAKSLRSRRAFSLVAVASLVRAVHPKSSGFESIGAAPVFTLSLATNNEDVNRTATVEIPDPHLIDESTEDTTVEAIDESLALSLERSRRFQADQDALLHDPTTSEAMDAAMAKLAVSVTEERTGLRALAKKLMVGTKLLFADLMQWRQLRLLPEESLTYDEV